MTIPFDRPVAVRTQGGYTVAEILVALLIGGLVLGALYGSYSTVVGSTRNYRRISDTYQTARVVLTNLSRELTGTYQPALATERLIFEGREEWFQGRRMDRISFVTTTSARGGGEEAGWDAFELSYFPGYGEREGYLLARRAPFYNLEEPFEGGAEMVVAEGVHSLAFDYYDGWEWKSEWDPEEEPLLPLAVRITLGLDGGGVIEPRYFTTAVSLPMARPLTEEDEGDDIVAE